MGKWKDRIKRYGLAEVAGTVTAISGALIAHKLTDNEIISAYSGAIGENVGYYGTILIRDFRQDREKSISEKGEYGLSDAMKTTRNLFLEFGLAECLDTLIVRPASMGLGTKILGQGIGTLAGKLLADVSFYFPTILLKEKIVNKLVEREEQNRINPVH